MSAATGRITEAQVRRELNRIDDRAARKRKIIGALVVLATALLAGALASLFLVTLVDVRGDGMSGTVNSGDVALCLKADAPFLARPVQRGTLALVRYLEAGMQRHALRRVIALGGDEISVDEDGRVILNGEPLEEPYAAWRTADDWNGGEVTPGGALENPFADPEDLPAAPATPAHAVEGLDDADFPLVVPEGSVFVLCDNRDNLLDSRSSRFGLIGQADILGTALATLWPVSRVGLLDGK